MTDSSQCHLGRKSDRRERRGRSDGSVVRPIRDAASGITKEAPLDAIYSHPSRAGPVAGRESPAVLSVATKIVRIAHRVFALNGSRLTAVFKIVTTLLAHEWILNASEIDPCVRELMDEERTCVEKIVAVQIFPLVRRGPCGIAIGGNRIGRRGYSQYI